MVIPAIAALVVSNYEGKDRAFAYGMLGGVAGAAIAVGPLIGGWVTTDFSWRYVFVGEVVVVIAILLVRARDEARPARRDAAEARLRRRGALGGRARDRRLLDPEDERVGLDPAARRADDRRARDHAVRLLRRAVPDRRRARDPLGASRSGRAVASGAGRTCCSTARCCGSCTCGPGCSTLLMQQLILMGTFFVLPVYLQVVLGFDAFETGKRLFPLSVALLLAALAGPKLAARLAPKRVCQAGLVALTIAAFFLVGTVDVELNDTGFAIALAVFGVGAGPAALAARQRDHVVGRPEQEQRGRRAPGHGAEPRRLARHGADRRGADLQPHDRLHRAGRGQPRRHAGRPGAARRRPSRPASRSSPSTTSSRRSSTRTCRPPRRPRSPRTTATRSSRR